VESGLEADTEATTVNEASGSGLRAIALAVDRIESGRVEAAVGGGMESMSNAPYASRDHRRGKRLGDSELVDTLVYDSLWDVTYDAHMGELTEALAERFDVGREAQDAYAAESNRRAAAAIAAGRFDEEVVPVETPDGELAEDEGPRPDSTVESLGELPPAFEEDGTITAGNASSLSDGAGCALLAGDDVAASFDPLAEVVDYAVSYRDPQWFGMFVDDVVEELLGRNDPSVDDVDTFELNEAFAAQMVYVAERLDVPRRSTTPRRRGRARAPHRRQRRHPDVDTRPPDASRGHDRGLVAMSGGGGIGMLLER
jgi:acetyl-CoA C-acetyltransferase